MARRGSGNKAKLCISSIGNYCSPSLSVQEGGINPSCHVFSYFQGREGAASPAETAPPPSDHLVRALSTAQGQLRPKNAVQPVRLATQGGRVHLYRVPASIRVMQAEVGQPRQCIANSEPSIRLSHSRSQYRAELDNSERRGAGRVRR